MDNPVKKNNSYCSVPECHSKGSSVSFHKFPRHDSTVTTMRSGCKEVINRRDEWTRLLKIEKKVSHRMCVCSLHFQNEDYILPAVPKKRKHLKKTAVPSLNLPVSSAERVGVLGRKSKARVPAVTKRAQHHENLTPKRLGSKFLEDIQSTSGLNKSLGWTGGPHVFQISGPQNKLNRLPKKEEKADGPTSLVSEGISKATIFDGTGIKSHTLLKKRLALAGMIIREMELHISHLKTENRKLQSVKENPLIESVHKIKDNAVEGELSAIILLNKIAAYEPES